MMAEELKEMLAKKGLSKFVEVMKDVGVTSKDNFELIESNFEFEMFIEGIKKKMNYEPNAMEQISFRKLCPKLLKSCDTHLSSYMQGLNITQS